MFRDVSKLDNFNHINNTHKYCIIRILVNYIGETHSRKHAFNLDICERQFHTSLEV